MIALAKFLSYETSREMVSHGQMIEIRWRLTDPAPDHFVRDI
jgi:hypothetical protein